MKRQGDVIMNNFGEDLRKLVLAGLGAVAVTAEKSKDVVDQLVKKGELTVEPVSYTHLELDMRLLQNVTILVLY